MKKFIVLFLILAVSLAACQASAEQSTPQVTVTSQATLTLPPPAPTAHLQWTALQEQIAASGGRFTLNANGTIEEVTADGARQTISGLTVSPEGVMTITVNGEPVTLDPAKTRFDNQTGLTNDDYKQDETGNWLPALETITIKGQQIAVDSEGYATVVAPDTLKGDKLTEFNDKYDADKLAVALGFGEGNLKWVVKTGEDGANRLVMVDPDQPDEEIAELGNGAVVWEWEKIKDSILNVGNLVPANGTVPADRNAQLSSYGRLIRAVKDVDPGTASDHSSHFLTTDDGDEGLIIITELNENEYATGKIEERKFINFWNQQNQAVSVFVDHFDMPRK